MAQLAYENIVVSDRGIFEVQHGRMMANVLRPEIKRVRVIQASSSNRPVVEAVIGTCLTAVGLSTAVLWIAGRIAFSDYLIVLLVAGPIGVAILYDVLRRRFVLLINSEARTHKLAFSTRAQREEIDRFCEAVRENYGIQIETKLTHRRMSR